MAESGDSSPHSAAATDDTHHDGSEAYAAAAAAAPAGHAPPPPVPVPAKVRLMVSYGGRIQPRPHDNQLAYVNGETKILSLERPLRFRDFAARLAALAGGSLGDVCVKYQLPGEDLDALVSVTNDEDLDHLVLEYDRLHLLRPAPGSSSGGGSNRGGGGGSTLRLRVFLFPVQPPPPPPPPQPSGLLEPKSAERHWFVEALNTFPQQQQPQPKQEKQQESVFAQQSPPPPQQQKQQESVFAQQQQQQQSPPPPPPQQQAKHETVFVQVQHQQQQPPPQTALQMAPPQPHMVLASASPDYLFGLDNGFVPPPAVKVKDPAGDPPTVRENVPVELPAKNDDRHPNPAPDHVAVSPAVPPAEFQRQIQELEKLQVADNATHQPPPAPAPAPAALSRNGSDDSLTRAYPPAAATPPANADYYLPKFPEKPPVPPPSSATAYLQMPGRYTSVAPPGSGADHAPVFFIPAPHGYFAAAASPGAATSYPAMYAVAPPSANANANANGNGSLPAVSNAAAYAPAPQVAYDSNGRAIYYTSMLPQYPSAANGMSAAGAVLGAEPAKPVAVKPTVS
jgi:hypothetical protein